MWRECCKASGHSIVEANTERNQQIRMRHPHIGGVAAVHTGHADEVRMIAWQRAESHKRAYSGYIQSLDELAKFSARIRRDNAPAGIDKRPLGFPHHLRGAADLSSMTLAVNLVARQMDL